MKHFLGIDTSNYTTSLALCDETGASVGTRRLLPVKEGERGLRQSDAVFHHVKAIPALAKELCDSFPHNSLCAVGVSATPRRETGSYMPCFLAGISAAAAVAAFFDLPLYEFSHQEGHIQAARLGSAMPPMTDYLAFHLSGGTLELLQVQENEGSFQVQILCDSADITLGQLIDRCGVKLGLPFPCGSALESLAPAANRHFPVRIPLNSGKVNLSGLENRFDALLASGETPENCAGFVFDCVIRAVHTVLAPYRGRPILFMGGVASSRLLKQSFAPWPQVFFSPASHSCDNALGIAALARERFLRGGSCGASPRAPQGAPLFRTE